jgi:peptidylprolyl isomerase domain and WD repeat-containing protein 1
MFDTEQDTTVLGKRGRNSDDDIGRVQDGEDGLIPAADADINQDDSDDDVGPMPLPPGANGGSKRKRRGGSYAYHSMIHRLTTQC